jgi:hypothetical protein
MVEQIVSVGSHLVRIKLVVEHGNCDKPSQLNLHNSVVPLLFSIVELFPDIKKEFVEKQKYTVKKRKFYILVEFSFFFVMFAFFFDIFLDVRKEYSYLKYNLVWAYVSMKTPFQGSYSYKFT